MVSFLVWGIYASPVFFVINYSTSLKERIFIWYKSVPTTLVSDDFILFTYKPVPGNLYFKLGHRLIKKIAGVPGDTIEYTPTLHRVCSSAAKSIVCKEFPRNTQDRIGKKLPTPFEVNNTTSGTLIIPPGFFYAYGTNPLSYDSRYFGLVARDQLIGKLTPLFGTNGN